MNERCNMTKKSIIYSIVAVAFLVVCFVIGQTISGPKVIKTDPSVYYDYLEKADELVYVGDKAADTPGGRSVGYVEDDTYGAYYLMTPDTAIRAGIILDDTSHILSFQYMIHEKVAELPDGMQLKVQILQEGTEDILYEDVLDVTAEKKDYELSFEEWKNQNVYIVFEFSDIKNNQKGDWLIMRNIKID